MTTWTDLLTDWDRLGSTWSAIDPAYEATLVSDLIKMTRGHLLGGMRERLNWTDGSIDGSQTTITLTDDVTGIKNGMLLEVDHELLYVRSVNTSTKVVTVRRGHEGTEAIAHNDDVEVRIDPAYTLTDIFRALLGELRMLNGSGVCVFESAEFVYDGSNPVVQMPSMPTGTNLIGIYDVFYEGSSATGSYHRPARWQLLKHVDTSDFSSGDAIQLLSGGMQGYPIRVLYKRSMASFEKFDDEVDVPGYAIEILPVGAAWRLLLGQEARRVNPRAEHGSRRSEEVPPNTNAFAARALQGMRQDLIESALEVQYRNYPILQRDA